jgi:predicted transcriptional regulator
MSLEMQTIVLKVSPEHKSAVQRIAAADREPVAVIMRQLIRQEAQRRGLWAESDEQRPRAAKKAVR